MVRYLISFIFIIFTFQISGVAASTGLKKLVKELVKNNIDVLTYEANAKLSSLDRQIFEDSFGFDLNAGLSHSKNELDAASAINFARGSQDSAMIAFGKNFLTGTRLELSNSLTKNEADPRNLVFLGGGPAIQYEFAQTFSLSQDLGRNVFGRQFEKKLDLYKSQQKASRLDGQYLKESKVFEFLNVYINASLQKEVIKFQSFALKRAIKRENFIKRRLRDNLSLKVDSLEARQSVLSQKEQLIEAKASYEKELLNLSTLMGRKVLDGEVFYLSEEDVLSYKAKKLDKSNLNIKALEQKLEAAKLNNTLSKNSLIPKIKLLASYKTNNFDVSSSKSVSNGNISGDDKEVKLGLNLLWDIGAPVESLEQVKTQVSLKLSEQKLRQMKVNLKENKRRLSKRIVLVSQRVKVSKEKADIAKNVLNEYSKLYRLGRTSFETIIRAQEKEISSQRNYVTYLAQDFILNAQLAFLNGELSQLILENKK